MTAILYLGYKRETEVVVELAPADAANGYGYVPCPECEGTGWWAYAEPEIPGEACVVCKGTSRVLVNC